MGKKAITLLELLIVVAVVCVISLSLSPLIRSTREQGRRYVCAENLRKTTIALRRYAVGHKGIYPDDLSVLYPEYIDDLKIFICPSDVDASDIAKDGSDIDVTTSYLYSRGWTEKDPLSTILVCDKNDIFGKDTNHRGKGGNVAYLSGEVKWVDTAEWINPVDKE
ncbi:MAG: type II secretion system protein [Candidatus Omnitrophica bacterium]|nr:type II secretion system protein [Candidatus Omnitrophota bacterium]